MGMDEEEGNDLAVQDREAKEHVTFSEISSTVKSRIKESPTIKDCAKDSGKEFFY